MQNLSVADIFPSSIPEHPRVQSPMNRDHGGKQFSDYFTPPAEPAYRPLIREPGMVPGFTSGSGAGMYPASDQLYNNMSSTSNLLKSPAAADQTSPAEGAYSTELYQSEQRIREQGEKLREDARSAEAAAESASARDAAAKEKAEKAAEHAASAGKNRQKQSEKQKESAAAPDKHAAKQAKVQGNGRDGNDRNVSGENETAVSRAAGEKNRDSSEAAKKAKAGAAEMGGAETKAGALGKATASGKAAEIHAEEAENAAAKASQASKSANAGSGSGKTGGTDSGNGAEAAAASQEAPGLKDQLGGDSRGENGEARGAEDGKYRKVASSQTSKSGESLRGKSAAENAGSDNASANAAAKGAGENGDPAMAASKNSDRHTEGHTRLKNPSGAGTGEAGKTQTVQSSILSQSMERISGRGGQNGASGTLSQAADAGDSKVLSSMVQQARDTAGGTFHGNAGDGGTGDGAKQGGTFSNSMFAQSSIQPGTSVSSSSDFQVFLGPEALARGAEGLQQGQGGRNSVAGAGGRQTMSSSEMMNQFKEQFRGQLGSDVVRQARYIFKGQNSGEISMVLKPEKLGRVRIKVNLQDNSVAGKIFVENKDVEAAFNEMLDDLKEMFQEQGFDDLSVDVQLENGSGEDTAQPFRMADDNGLSGTGEQAGSFENQIAQARSYLREYESLDILA